jgi:DNA-directed RNA polymerase specialized sigma24 family protein
MNPSKMINVSQVSPEELRFEFNKLVNKYMPYIRSAIRLSLISRDEEIIKDYTQEALIHCWKYFQRRYTGPTPPCHSDGTPYVSWQDWFFRYAKYGFLEAYRKNNPIKAIKINTFSRMPECFCPADKLNDYDFEKETKIQKLEQIIFEQSGNLYNYLTTYIRTDLNFKKTCEIVYGKYNNVSISFAHWALQVLKHKFSIAQDSVHSERFKQLGFLELVKYTTHVYSACISNPNDRAQTIAAYGYVMGAIEVCGLADIHINQFGKNEYCQLLFELRKEQYIKKDEPIVFKRRLNFIFDLFVDLGIIDVNPFKGIVIAVSKDGSRFLIQGETRGRRGCLV